MSVKNYDFSDYITFLRNVYIIENVEYLGPQKLESFGAKNERQKFIKLKQLPKSKHLN